MRRIISLLVVLSAALFAALPANGAEPKFDSAFWKQWGDGKAELAGYEIVFPRYGEKRKGTAVTVFVSETFSNELRVKADPGRHPKSDEVPVLKLNFVQDFPTGIYDYNIMTSSFVTLQSADGTPAGSPTKVSFSSQEWCGHVYSQVLFDKDAVRQSTHSYFDGEADSTGKVRKPAAALSEDILFHWARGYAAPYLEPGESKQLPILRSLTYSRLRHKPLQWSTVTLTRGEKPTQVKTAGGTHTVEVLNAAIANGPDWTFHVEIGGQRRLISWKTSEGYTGQLIASSRQPYWQMNSENFESAVEKLGLNKRPARTP